MVSHSSTSSTSSMSTLSCAVAASVATVLVATTLRQVRSFATVPVGSTRRRIASSFITLLLLLFLGTQVSTTLTLLYSHITVKHYTLYFTAYLSFFSIESSDKNFYIFFVIISTLVFFFFFYNQQYIGLI